jgi:hypothetical protein
MKPRRVPGHPNLYREELGKEGTRYRIVLSRNNQTFQEYFYFGKTRRESAARAAAIARLKKLHVSFPPLTRSAFAQVERRKSRSGMVGVRLVTDVVKGHPYDFWTAVWSDRRRNKRMRKFSVLKYGDKEAKKLAMRARAEGLAAMDG